MIDHLPQLAIWDSAVDLDGVPMLFAHVISRPDLLISIAQLEGEIWITFQVRCCRHHIQRNQCKHFPSYFEDQHVFAEWRAFRRAEFGQAIFAKLFDIHFEL